MSSVAIAVSSPAIHKIKRLSYERSLQAGLRKDFVLPFELLLHIISFLCCPSDVCSLINVLVTGEYSEQQWSEYAELMCCWYATYSKVFGVQKMHLAQIQLPNLLPVRSIMYSNELGVDCDAMHNFEYREYFMFFAFVTNSHDIIELEDRPVMCIKSICKLYARHKAFCEQKKFAVTLDTLLLYRRITTEYCARLDETENLVINSTSFGSGDWARMEFDAIFLFFKLGSPELFTDEVNNYYFPAIE